MHKHLCLACDAVINEGEFDCERDTDHDYALCTNCSETEYEVTARVKQAGYPLTWDMEN